MKYAFCHNPLQGRLYQRSHSSAVKYSELTETPVDNNIASYQHKHIINLKTVKLTETLTVLVIKTLPSEEFRNHHLIF